MTYSTVRRLWSEIDRFVAQVKDAVDYLNGLTTDLRNLINCVSIPVETQLSLEQTYRWEDFFQSCCPGDLRCSWLLVEFKFEARKPLPGDRRLSDCFEDFFRAIDSCRKSGWETRPWNLEYQTATALSVSLKLPENAPLCYFLMLLLDPLVHYRDYVKQAGRFLVWAREERIASLSSLIPGSLGDIVFPYR